MLRTRGSGWIRIDFGRSDPDQAKMTHKNEHLKKFHCGIFSFEGWRLSPIAWTAYLDISIRKKVFFLSACKSGSHKSLDPDPEFDPDPLCP
jgi:hypothetical protein